MNFVYCTHTHTNNPMMAWDFCNQYREQQWQCQKQQQRLNGSAMVFNEWKYRWERGQRERENNIVVLPIEILLSIFFNQCLALNNSECVYSWECYEFQFSLEIFMNEMTTISVHELQMYSKYRSCQSAPRVTGVRNVLEKQIGTRCYLRI